MVISAGNLEKLCNAILVAAGALSDEAETVARIVVEADLRGVTSHGIRNIPRYVRAIQAGEIIPGASIEVVKDTHTTALWDLHNAFGFIAAEKAMNQAIEKARQNHLGAVGTFNSLRGDDHIGALGYYSEMAASRGMIGIVHSTRTPRMAPWGGKDKLVGINPLSIAVPGHSVFPVVLDISMTPTSRGHLGVKMTRGERVPKGWILDADGQPTTDPRDFFGDREGIFLPFGAHKGYGLAVALEAVTGALGAGCGPGTIGYGHLHVAIDPEGFISLDIFTQRVDAFIESLKQCSTVSGVTEVYYPGEIEARTRRERLKCGIPVEKEYWDSLIEIASQMDVDLTLYRGMTSY